MIDIAGSNPSPEAERSPVRLEAQELVLSDRRGRERIIATAGAARLEVAAASPCDSYVEPDRPDLLANEEETEESSTDETGF